MHTTFIILNHLERNKRTGYFHFSLLPKKISIPMIFWNLYLIKHLPTYIFYCFFVEKRNNLSISRPSNSCWVVQLKRKFNWNNKKLNLFLDQRALKSWESGFPHNLNDLWMRLHCCLGEGELAGWEEITPIFQSILLASNW